jgi:hypothetical protein
MGVGLAAHLTGYDTRIVVVMFALFVARRVLSRSAPSRADFGSSSHTRLLQTTDLLDRRPMGTQH